jgi:LDH2 family malate/lactate/ureidoglycolate dehydrogenase
MVDIFSAVLSGANYGPWVPPFVAFLEPPSDPVGEGIGHFLGAMRVDAFRPSSEFKQHMDQWIRRFSESEPVHGHKRVMIPGDPEREMEEERKQFGIPLLQAVWDDLTEMALRFDLSLPTKK